MRLLACLLIVMAVTAATFYVQGDLAEGLPISRAMTAGFMILGAWLTGRLFDRVSLPKICGYLLFGLAVGPSLWSMMPVAQWTGAAADAVERVMPLVSTDQVKSLRFIGDLAVALIALTAGGEIDLRWLRERLGRLGVLTAVDTLLTIGVMIAAMMLARPLIPFMSQLDTKTAWVVSIVGAAVMISNSPTVVIAMLSDLRAAGPLSQMTLAFVVCKDLVLIVLFAAAMAIGRGVLEGTAISGGFLLAVAVELLGSVALGALLGIGMAFYVQRVRAHLLIFLVGCCMLFALLGDQPFAIYGHSGHLEPLLMALSAGLLMQNLWPDSSRPLFRTIESMSLPVYALFFAVAGAKIDLLAFQSLWYVSLGLVVVRAAAVWTGMRIGLKLSAIPEPWAQRLWLGLIPQAGVSLVLVALVDRSFRDTEWGPDLSSMLIGMIVMHELVGPVGFRWALMREGEVGRSGAISSGH